MEGEVLERIYAAEVRAIGGTTMKKILTLMMSMMLFAGLSACSGSEDEDGVKTIDVGVSIYKFEDNHYSL